MRDPQLVGRLRAANARLRELLRVRDGEIEALRWDKERETAELGEVLRLLTLRVAELERQLRSGSDDSGTPTSKEPIAARARRKAERQARREADTSSRERSVDRSRGGQPGHLGRGLVRDRDPQHREQVEPPVVCRGCGAGLHEAQEAGTAWSGCWDVRVIRWRTEYLLPRRRCACSVVTTARPPSGGPVNGICFGPVLNTAAVALTAFGNVPTERAAHLVGMLTGQKVSAGFVDRANARLGEQLTRAGFDDALLRALLGESVLTADESPVEVVTAAKDPGTGEPVPGAPHVLVLRTPDERLVRLTAADSRRHEEVVASLRTFTGYLIVDGYGAYQKLLPSPIADPSGGCGETVCEQANETVDDAVPTGLLAGIQQCCQHITRRCKQVAKLGPAACSPGQRRSSRCWVRPTIRSKRPRLTVTPPWTPTS
ncbi:MAG: IS66 family transposase [Streptomycetales bacterium]